MPTFGAVSRRNLSTCHPDLVEIAEAAIERIDFQVREGHRGKHLQDMYFRQGKSKVQYPNGNHNTWPSLALDFVPWPFDDTARAWSEEGRFQAVFDALNKEAAKRGIKLSWGGTWKSLHDIPHVELVSKNGKKYPKTYKPTNDEY